MIKVIVAPCRRVRSLVGGRRRCVDAAAQPILARLFHAVTWAERFNQGYPWRSRETAASWPDSVSRTRRCPPTTTSCRRRYDAAVETARLGSGRSIRCGSATTRRVPTTRSPPARRSTTTWWSGVFAEAAAADVDDVVTSAAEAFERWSATPWRERCEILDRVADLISERSRRGRRAHGVGERQEPARGDSARSRKRPI